MLIKRFKMKLGTKILCLVFVVILLFSASVGTVMLKEITENMKQMATEKAKGDLALSSTYIDDVMSGDWQVKNNKLYKGQTQINGNEDIVDLLGEKTGDTITIFQGDTRVATNVMKNGERAVGTQASSEVIAAVLKKGKRFYGQADVAGSSYQTAYMPLKDQNGNIIGMLYTGANQSILASLTQSLFTQFAIVLVIVIMVSVILVLVFTRKINKRLNALKSAFESAGNGDMTIEVSDKTGDELSELSVYYNKMRMKLNDTIQTVQQSALQLASASQQLSAGAEETNQASEKITEAVQQIANGAQDQITRIENSESSLKQASADIRDISANTAAIADKGQLAQSKADIGQKEIANVQAQMDAIHQSIQKSGEIIHQLDGRSKQIEQILSVITQIADQTNLLALNAAIEAARAGEQGKGFAVVADEVRKLAEESQQSAGQISKLIIEIQKDMNRSARSVEYVKTEAAEGVTMIQRTRDAFKEIAAATGEISAEISDLSASVTNISASAHHINDSFAANTTDIKESTKNTRQAAALTEEQFAAMEEITAASETLSQLAEELTGIISQFKMINQAENG
ncbi:methyl-accepting chemotaxis protein TlpC [Bacillus subtilis]|uniref:methyl-accepting chemotaxis protein TlpC n=1 Tax=Bacillus subtilis TaxID=1423 RepID=UPI002DBB62A1|nr:methyl-accepting chemotaxis protein TlpC [Bacillus subtilis]MEC2381113.1 methyl-accepting chemotaxis protein TlpC [Bacillus subtilis]MEC2385507.1 methyl-accepting chemotaxis protein TlpC [Bacillus subtilis]MEC2403745.1 methyl-accepting chemotaxis protein TlpC [Bacillus subtilis]MEC2415725.1 methyl-accepting chemotaxis protein TlpC [Bacillus subtilis]MEC2417356.1 methyl-accepting chemotaxis protein TlpC [Bacillus subtilis]